jgi:putative flippase GtrA
VFKLLNKLVSVQMFRYLLAGSVNTGFAYGVYALVVFVGGGYRWAALISAVLGVVFSFLVQGSFVFQALSWHSMIRYFGVWAVLYFVNIEIIGWLLTLGLNAYVSGALSTVPMVILGYLAMKYFVFKPASAPTSTHAK